MPTSLAMAVFADLGWARTEVRKFSDSMIETRRFVVGAGADAVVVLREAEIVDCGTTRHDSDLRDDGANHETAANGGS